jgi:hypothetical protein
MASPQGCGGRQTVHGEPLPEDHPAAQKADAGEDAMRHPHRVDPDDIVRRVGQPAHLMHRGEHQQRRGEADQDVGPQTRGTSAILAL